jgi:adenosylcobinamide kinase / adenosylcobinamide-phosphate guanylyltransferase
MRIFISGGCKNGKSYYAQNLAKAQQVRSLYYIAAMKSVDAEDDERIKRHRFDREGWGFTTIEQAVDIEKILDKCDSGGSFLLDSLTALLANEMFPSDGIINELVPEKITKGLEDVTKKIKNIVMVSDYIYSDAFLYDPLTEKFRRSLAETDRCAAGICDVVLEITYTNVIVHKGRKIFDELYKKIP